MPDFVLYGRQLDQGLLLGGVAHPVQTLDVAPECVFQRVDHLQRALFGFGREVLLHVNLPQSLAQVAVHGSDTAFPASPQFLGSRERLAVEVEVLVYKGLGKVLHLRVNQAPAEVSLEIVETHTVELCVERLEKIRVGDVQAGHAGCADIGQVFGPGERRSERLPLLCKYLTDVGAPSVRSEEHTSELQSPLNFECRLLLE